MITDTQIVAALDGGTLRPKDVGLSCFEVRYFGPIDETMLPQPPTPYLTLEEETDQFMTHFDWPDERRAGAVAMVQQIREDRQREREWEREAAYILRGRTIIASYYDDRGTSGKVTLADMEPTTLPCVEIQGVSAFRTDGSVVDVLYDDTEIVDRLGQVLTAA